MARRYFNWKLAVVVLIGMAVLAATAFGLRQWQRSHRAQRGLALGTKAFEAGDWALAAKHLGSYVGVAQNDAPAMLKYAQAQMNIRPVGRGNVKQAMAAYHTVLRLEPGNVEAAKNLGELYLGMNMPGEAELIVSRCMQITSSPDLSRIFVVSLANQRKIPQAVSELKKMLEANPREVWAYEVLGRLAEQRNADFKDEPASWFDKAISVNPASTEAYIARASYFLRAGRKNDAITDLTKAQELDLPDSKQRLSLAQQLINTGLLDHAKKQLEIVHKAEPNNQTLWICWAELTLKSDSNEATCWVAQNGLKELSNQPYDFMPLAAQLYIRCDQVDKAAECVNTMRQKDIAPPTRAYLEGLIAEKRGNGYEAVRCWQQAIELGAKSASVRLALARTLFRVGDRLSAINQLRTLVVEQPKNFEVSLALARMLAETGQWSAAVEQVRQARQILPQNVDAALLDVQARLQILSITGAAGNATQYQEMEDTLSKLDTATNGAIEVKLVMLQFALQRGNLDNAGAIAAQLKEKYPENPRVQVAQARLLVAQDKTDEAIRLLNESVRRLPASAGLLGYLVDLLAVDNRLDQAEQVVKIAVESAKTPAEKRELNLMLSDVYAAAKQADKRYSTLDSLSQQLQDDILVMSKLLSCEKVANDPVRAQKIIDRIKAVAGDSNWQWRYEQARLWYAQKDFDAHYPRIITLLSENLLSNPDDKASRLLMAEAHNRAGKDRLAISAYEEALSRSPRDARIVARLASALYGANEFDRAETVLQQAAKNGVEHPDLKRMELQGYLKRGQLNSASDVMGQLLKDDPNNDQVGLSLSLLKMRQGDFIGARTLLNGIAERNGNSFVVTAAQIELKVREGKNDDAMQLCDKLVQEKNNAFAYVVRGRVKASLDDKQSANEDFKKAVEMEPNNVDALMAKIEFAGSAGMIDEAIADAEKALVLAPDNVAVQQRAVALLLSSNKAQLRERGESILNSAIEANPDDTGLRLQKARLLLNAGTAPAIEEATAILEKITESRPAQAEAWALLAQTAIRQGLTSKAIDVASRGLVYRPNDKSLMLLKGRAEAVRSPLLAIPTLKSILEQEPNDITVLLMLAETYITADEPDKAIQMLNSRLSSSQQTDEDKRRLNLTLAVATYKSGKVSEANEVLKSLSDSAPDDPGPLLVELGLLKDDGLWDKLSQKAIDWCLAHPNDVQATVRIADVLASMKNDKAIKTAENLLRDTISREPNLAAAYMKLGMLLQTTGRFEEAVKIYQRQLELEPENVIVINNLAWLLCEELSKYNEALALTERGLTLDPDYADLIDTRGMAYYRLGKPDKAVEDFRHCVFLYSKRTPSLVNTYFHLGRALMQLGQKAEAKGQLSKAIELNNEIKALSPEDSAEAKKLIESLSKEGG